MIHAVSHALLDTLQALPILFLVYLLLEYLESRGAVQTLANRIEKVGPAAVALVGCSHHCGIEAAAASM